MFKVLRYYLIRDLRNKNLVIERAEVHDKFLIVAFKINDKGYKYEDFYS